MREKAIEKYLREQVQKHGGICKKWVCPGQRGVPDRIVIFHGAVFFVELKSPTGKLRPEQEAFHKVLRQLDQPVLVLSSKEQVKMWVELQASVLALIRYPHPQVTKAHLTQFDPDTPSPYDLNTIGGIRRKS